jgi:hypothetical protein
MLNFGVNNYLNELTEIEEEFWRKELPITAMKISCFDKYRNIYK